MAGTVGTPCPRVQSVFAERRIAAPRAIKLGNQQHIQRQKDIDRPAGL
jgi:hypothetical protein